LGKALSDCGISAAGTVDADALPTSERPSPAPIAVNAAVLPVRLCVEAFLTMVAYSRGFHESARRGERAPDARSAQELRHTGTQNKS
jgi:hypothetical protein